MRAHRVESVRDFRVESLALENYRGFKSLNVDEWGKLNLLVGINGSGKSAILQAIAVGLSHFTSALVGDTDLVPFAADDVHNGALRGEVRVELVGNGRSFEQSTFQKAPGAPGPSLTTRKNGFDRLSDEYAEAVERDRSTALPVIVWYSVSRSVSEIAPEASERAQYFPISAYAGAFDSSRRFQTFFEWFRDREDLENQRLARGEKRRDFQLSAVRNAIESLMPGYSDLHIDRAPLRMLLRKGEQELNFNQLSDGEKILFALAGDLARRLAIANPESEKPLLGTGIALIDEVDLHLHPTWQRRIIKLLPEVFPGLQFFLTTHSPIVASSAPRGSLFVVNDGRITQHDAFGQEVGLVLDEVFGTEVRDQDIGEKIDMMFETLARGKNAVALELLEELEATLGINDPALIKARIRMRGSGVL